MLRNMDRKSLKYILAFGLLILLQTMAFAEQSTQMLPSKEPVVVNGDKVEYFHEQKKVIGEGNISIEYRDVLLTCDKITVYLDTREALAEGNVKIAQKGAYFTGDRMNYNFDTRQGTVLKGYLNANPFYGQAKELGKVANKDQFNMDYGYVTTCDLDKPHYRIQSKKVKIYLGDKVVAYNIFIFLGNVPIMYFPYYIQPLNEKKTHITVTPGENSDWGYYALTALRYHLDDKNSGDILIDYRAKQGLAGGVNHYYEIPEMGKGAFKFYYTQENNGLAYEPSGPERTRYRYQVRHNWDMGNGTDTRVTLELNKLSDPDIIKDYFYNEYEELGAQPDNYLSVITQKEYYMTEFLIRKRLDDFYTVVQRLPEFRMEIPNVRILGDLPVYYQSSTSGVYLDQAFVNTDPATKNISTVRFDSYNQLSYAARVFKALNVTPYAGIRQTYYSRNKWGDTNLVRGIFSAGVANSIKFYKIYDVTTNFMGLNINKLRHVITPVVNYYYMHQPTISPDNLNQFDAIDAFTAQNGAILSIENRLQTKRLVGNDMKSVDLATLLISTDYAFRLNKNNTSYKRQKFSPITFKLELIPYSWAYLTGDMTIDTKDGSLQTASVDLVSTGGDKWDLAAGYRYEGLDSGTNSFATMDGGYKINDKWRVRVYERFNLATGGFEEQEYTISRDLHCWIAELTVNLEGNYGNSIWLVFKLKAFPDYPIGMKRTYSRPRFGEAGSPPPSSQ